MKNISKKIIVPIFYYFLVKTITFYINVKTVWKRKFSVLEHLELLLNSK